MKIVRVVLVFLAGFAVAQDISTREWLGVRLFSVTDLGRVLGEPLTTFGSSATLRAPDGVATLFIGSADLLWQPAGAGAAEDVRLSVPVREEDGHVWAALDLLELAGYQVTGPVATRPGSFRLLLGAPGEQVELPGLRGAAWEEVDLGGSARGLRFTSGDLSVLLADPVVLGLAFPELREAFDSFTAETAGMRPLVFVLTSASDGPWTPRFTVAGRVLAPPRGLVLLEGSLESVGPEHPVTGVLLLPPEVNLRLPQTVEWQQISTRFQFRR